MIERERVEDAVVNGLERAEAMQKEFDKDWKESKGRIANHRQQMNEWNPRLLNKGK